MQQLAGIAKSVSNEHINQIDIFYFAIHNLSTKSVSESSEKEISWRHKKKR